MKQTEPRDEWIDASTERRWEMLRELLTKHLEYNVFITITAMNIAALFGAHELAELFVVFVLGLYTIVLSLMGFMILLLLLLSFLTDEEV